MAHSWFNMYEKSWIFEQKLVKSNDSSLKMWKVFLLQCHWIWKTTPNFYYTWKCGYAYICMSSLPVSCKFEHSSKSELSFFMDLKSNSSRGTNSHTLTHTYAHNSRYNSTTMRKFCQVYHDDKLYGEHNIGYINSIVILQQTGHDIAFNRCKRMKIHDEKSLFFNIPTLCKPKCSVTNANEKKLILK